MSGLQSGLNANVVKTALDKVFKQSFDGTKHPNHVDATSEKVFKQDSIDRGAVITEIFKGTGLWGAKAENADVPQATPRVANQQTFTVTEFAQSVDISKNFFDDEQHSVYEKMVSDMAVTGRITRDSNAFERWRLSFTTALTNDGSTICADSHTTLSGVAVDNLAAAAALSETTLNNLIISLVEQKAQDGSIRGNVPATLLVPPALFKKACEITDSELRSGTGNNDMNVYSDKYGIMVATSPYLGAVNTSGSDTAYWLLSDNHSMRRWVRQGVITDLVDYKYQRNNNYIYKGSFREVVGCEDYVGIVGSVGA